MSFNTNELFNKSEDELLFCDDDELFAEDDEGHQLISDNVWKVLLVDDEKEVHTVTTMVLRDFHFDEKPIEFLHAYSGKEAREILQEHSDIALVLLDVVMEKDDSGLQIVKFVREELQNKTIRIILRTGQPGQAPEKLVITEYDINDYKEKTELTSQKLFTTVIAALRSYRDIMIIERNRRGLEDIIHSSANIFKLQSMKRFATGVLKQLTSILQLDNDAIHCNSIAVTKGKENFYVLAGTGEYSNTETELVEELVTPEVYKLIRRAFNDRTSFTMDKHIVCFFQSKAGADNVIYLHGSSQLHEFDQYLIDIYCANVSIAFENIYLNEEVEITQREIIFTLGEVAETRSKETGFHVKRVAEYSKLLALKYGLSEEEAETIRLASPMHDIGKIAIPDRILSKPAKLTENEFDVMKAHSRIGYEMLKHSNRTIMKAAATIALEHHEKFDGSGYPNGKEGEAIHLYGRIVAVADVFDALSTKRVYKEEWDINRIVTLFKEERGKHFDPLLVDLFLDNLDEFIEIKKKYNDEKIF